MKRPHDYQIRWKNIGLSVSVAAVLFAIVSSFLLSSREEVERNGLPCGRASDFEQRFTHENFLLGNRVSYVCEEDMSPTGIILHYTATDSFFRTLDVLEKRGLYVHLVVDTDGKTYQIMDTLTERAAGAPGSNGWAIHVEIVGDGELLLMDAENNGPQFQGVVRTVKILSELYNIPLTNDHTAQDSTVWRGIFSHEQISKYHPEGARNGKTDPGEEYMTRVLQALTIQ